MAKSYRLVMNDIKQRRPRLPDHLFRWSGGNFYSYLAGQAYGGGRRTEALKWLVEVVKADPWMVLAPYTVRTTVRSLIWLILRPITTRIWPTRKDWMTFKRRHGLSKLVPTTRDAVEAGATPVDTPWEEGGAFDRIRVKRWRSLSHPRPPEPEPIPSPTGDL